MSALNKATTVIAKPWIPTTALRVALGLSSIAAAGSTFNVTITNMVVNTDIADMVFGNASGAQSGNLCAAQHQSMGTCLHG